MKKNILLIVLLTSIITYGQTDCGFKIDEEKMSKTEKIDSLITILKKDKFKITNKKEDIPKHILEQLICEKGEFSIANPSENYQNIDVNPNEKLPKRGLVFLALSKNNLIIVYDLNGSGRYVLINFDDTGIKDFFCAISYGIPNINSLKQIKEVFKNYRKKTKL